MTFALISTWLSIIFYKNIRKFFYILPIIIVILSFVPLPELYPLPYGIVIEKINSDYQKSILVLLFLLLYLAPKKLELLSLGLTLATLQAIQTKDWFNMYVSFELLLILVFIAGVLTDWRQRQKYFELQIIASCFVLFGIIRLYAKSGDLVIGDITDLFWSIGLIMKLGIWPFEKILQIYLCINNKYFYLFIVCIISKSLLYLIRFCDLFFIKIFLLANLLKASFFVLLEISKNWDNKLDTANNDISPIIKINNTQRNSQEESMATEDELQKVDLSLNTSATLPFRLNLANLMASNTFLGLMILNNSKLASIYVFYFFISQLFLIFNYKKSFYLLASGIPLSLGFFAKIVFLREISEPMDIAFLVLYSVIFCIGTSQEVLKDLKTSKLS